MKWAKRPSSFRFAGVRGGGDWIAWSRPTRNRRAGCSHPSRQKSCRVLQPDRRFPYFKPIHGPAPCLGSRGCTSKCSWPSSDAAPLRWAAIWISAPAAAIAPSRITRAPTGTARSARARYATAGPPRVAPSCWLHSGCAPTVSSFATLPSSPSVLALREVDRNHFMIQNRRNRNTHRSV
jgi:hypothetical protein